MSSEDKALEEVAAVEMINCRSSTANRNYSSTINRFSTHLHAAAPDSAISLGTGALEKDLRKTAIEVKERFGPFFEEYKGTSRITAGFFAIELLHKFFVAMSIGVSAGIDIMPRK